jgi:hypothetical protein
MKKYLNRRRRVLDSGGGGRYAKANEQSVTGDEHEREKETDSGAAYIPRLYRQPCAPYIHR